MCIHHCFQNTYRHFDKDPNDILAPLKVIIDAKNFKISTSNYTTTKFYTRCGCSCVHAHDQLVVTGKVVFAYSCSTLRAGLKMFGRLLRIEQVFEVCEKTIETLVLVFAIAFVND